MPLKFSPKLINQNVTPQITFNLHRNLIRIYFLLKIKDRNIVAAQVKEGRITRYEGLKKRYGEYMVFRNELSKSEIVGEVLRSKLPLILDTISRYWPLSKNQHAEISMALGELLSNIMIHGSKKNFVTSDGFYYDAKIGIGFHFKDNNSLIVTCFTENSVQIDEFCLEGKENKDPRRLTTESMRKRLLEENIIKHILLPYGNGMLQIMHEKSFRLQKIGKTNDGYLILARKTIRHEIFLKKVFVNFSKFYKTISVDNTFKSFWYFYHSIKGPSSASSYTKKIVKKIRKKGNYNDMVEIKSTNTGTDKKKTF